MYKHVKYYSENKGFALININQQFSLSREINSFVSVAQGVVRQHLVTQLVIFKMTH